MTNVQENWLPIPNYEGLYEISDLGRVKSLPNKTHKESKILKNTLNKYGYHKLHLFKDKKTKFTTVHRMVMLSFVGESKLAIDHVDGNKQNNRLDNLRYCTNRENCNFYYKNKKSSSKYVNVHYWEQRNKWVARITINKKLILIGCYNTEDEAGNAVREYKKINNIQ